MGEAEKVIQTRQETETVPFDGAEIDALGILESAVRRSEGYDALVGIISADQAFTLEILGAPAVPITGDLPQDGPGTFILLYTDASVADAETGRQVVIVDRQVLSAYTKLRLTAGATPISGLEATVDLVAVYGWKRVDAQVVLPPIASVAINDAGGGTTEVSVKTPGTVIPATDGSILVGGVDQGGAQQPLEVILTGGVFRLAVDAIISGPAGTFAQGDFDSIPVDEATATAQWVRAAVTANDSSNAVGSRNIPVQARAASTGQDVTLYRLLVDSATRGLDPTTGLWTVIFSDLPSSFAAAGRSSSGVESLWTNSLAVGIDNTGAAVLRPVEARDAAADADFAAALVGMLSNARLAAYRVALGDFQRLTADTPAAITGESAAGNIYLRTASAIFGRDTSDSTMRAVETRNADADADFAGVLFGLNVNARLAAYRVALNDWAVLRSDTPDAASGGSSSSADAIGVKTISAIFGRNTTDSTMRAVEARPVSDGIGDAIYGLVTSSCVKGYDPAAGNHQPIFADIPSSYSAAGRAASAVRGLWTNALAVGIDNTGAAVLRPVEARSAPVTKANIADGLVGLTVNSRNAVWSLPTSEWRSQSGTDDPISANLTFANVVEARETGNVASLAGRRFSFTHQTPGTLITAQATFVATTPTLLLYNSAGNATTIILRTVRVVVMEATTAPVMICVAIDTADRFSAGGTVINGQNWNEASAVTYPGTDFRFNATATAAGAGTRYLWTDAIPTGLGGSITISFKDGIIIGGVGSILIYCWDSAGANAPDIVEDVEVEAF